MTKTLNTIDEFQKVLSEGPLDPLEAERRAKIAFFNDLYTLYQEKFEAMRLAPGFHPETRQVLAAEGLLLLEVGNTYGSLVGVSVYGNEDEATLNKENSDEGSM